MNRSKWWREGVLAVLMLGWAVGAGAQTETAGISPAFDAIVQAAWQRAQTPPQDQTLPQNPPQQTPPPQAPPVPEPLVWGAQSPLGDGGFKDGVKILGGDFKALFAWRNAMWLAGGGGLAWAVSPLDDDINDNLADSNWFGPGKVLGYSWVQMGGAVVTFTVGKLTHHPKVSHLAGDLLRAQILAQGMTYAIKYTVQRERPDGSSGYSFPSGHASVTFATARVLTQHLGWKGAVPGYLLASYVAASRLHENRHFLSDVVFGAAIGIVAGRTATRPGHSSWTWTPMSAPGGGGILVQRTFGDPVAP